MRRSNKRSRESEAGSVDDEPTAGLVYVPLAARKVQLPLAAFAGERCGASVFGSETS